MRALVKSFMPLCQNETLLQDLHTASLLCVTTVEGLTPAMFVNDCGHVMTDEDDTVEHVTRLLAGYLYLTTDTVPDQFTSMTPYVTTLLVRAVGSQRLRMPAADGQVYRRGQAS